LLRSSPFEDSVVGEALGTNWLFRKDSWLDAQGTAKKNIRAQEKHKREAIQIYLFHHWIS